MFIWRLFGFNIAKDAHVAAFTIVVADFIHMESGSSIDPLSFIYCPLKLELGVRARIGSFVKIIGWGGEVQLEKQSFIGLGCLIDSSGGFILGSRSQIGPRTMIYTHGASPLMFNMRFPSRNGPVTISNDVWIGMGCIIHPNVDIGRELIVFPGLTIRKSQPDFQSIVPLTSEFREFETERLIMGGVSDDILLSRVKCFYNNLANSIEAVVNRDEHSDLWLMSGLNIPSVVLVLNSTDEANGVLAKLHDTVIWSLYNCESVDPSNTVFCFVEWTIYGEKSAFTEKISDILMRTGGPHFIYKSSE